jgi:hypothetical protein
MLYVYKQFEQPTNTTGVPVMISVIDANGNYREIGTVTSDSSGFYSLSWMPDIPGEYKVIATFAGSKAYYGSYDQGTFVVDETQTTELPQSTPAPGIADQYFIPAIVVLFVAIVICIVMVALVLRKHS